MPKDSTSTGKRYLVLLEMNLGGLRVQKCGTVSMSDLRKLVGGDGIFGRKRKIISNSCIRNILLSKRMPGHMVATALSTGVNSAIRRRELWDSEMKKRN